MAYELVSEVIRDAPRDLSASDMVVLLVIAEAAGVKPGRTRSGQELRPRECVMMQETVLARTRIAERTLRDVYERLRARGLEVRVQIDETKTGRPVFAYTGRATTFRLPTFEKAAESAGEAAESADCSAESAVQPAESAESAAESAPRTVGEPLEEPPGEPSVEPGSDRWRDRGRRGASSARGPAEALEVPAWVTDEETAWMFLDDVLNGPHEATVRGILASHPRSIRAAVHIAYNTIKDQEAA